MHTKRIILITLVILSTLCTLVLADFPRILNYQGRLLDDSGNPINDTVELEFGIFADSLASVQLFKETHTSVVVTEGLFNVLLGSKKPLADSVFNGPVRWLGIEVDFGAMLTPLTPIVSSAYSYQSGRADTAVYALTAPGGVDGWTQSGNYVRLADNTDSVGIGVSNPLEKLHVGGNLILGGYGDIRFSPDNTRIDCDLNDLKIHAEADLYLEPYDDIYIRKYGGANFTRIDLDNSKIGIGTHSPNERLHIENDQSGGRAFLQIEASHPTNWHEAGLRFKTPQNTWHLRMDDDLNNNIHAGALGLRSQSYNTEVMTWEEDGYVGIGTINPQQKLHVNGNAKINDTLYVGALPEDFLSSENISDETGTANYAAYTITTLSESWQTMASCAIETPGPGYVLLIASMDVSIEHGAFGQTGILYGISDTPDTVKWAEKFYYKLPPEADAGDYYISAAVHRLFAAPTAGTYTYYLLAEKYLTDNYVSVARRVLTAVFIPTAYGNVPSKEYIDENALQADVDRTTLQNNKQDVQPTVTNQADLEERLEAMQAEINELKRRLDGN